MSFLPVAPASPVDLLAFNPRLRQVAGPVAGVPGFEGEGEGETRVRLATALRERGTVSFWLRLPEALSVPRKDGERLAYRLISAPGRLDFNITVSSEVRLLWQWNREEWKSPVNNLWAAVPRLPEGEWIHFAYVWDAAEGIFDGSINGTALREPGTRIPPWRVEAALESLSFDLSRVAVAGLEVEKRAVPLEELRRRLPAGVAGSLAQTLGAVAKRPLDWNRWRRGELLYETRFDDPVAVEHGWTAEGAMKRRFEGGELHAESAKPEEPQGEGNFVFWLRRELPENFYAEWETRILSEHGLCIVFFAGKGLHGEDLFDPGLARRNGLFAAYTKGDLNSYHISYYADTPETPGRLTANLRKNRGFYLVSNGLPGISAHSGDWHTVSLLKAGGRIQLAVDGEVSIDWTDDGSTFGPALGAGKLGLRQMVPTVAAYRRFRVDAIAP